MIGIEKCESSSQTIELKVSVSGLGRAGLAGNLEAGEKK